MKAMILAAGRGTRMGELTKNIPKPLLKVNGQPLIVHHLLKLAAAGIHEVVINVFYLADQIIETLGDGYQYDVNIQYIKQPQLFDVGGDLLNALPILGKKPFILISADIYSDFAYASLPQELSEHLAHFVVIKNPHYNAIGDFGKMQTDILYKENYFTLTQNEPLAYTYASISVVHPELIQQFSPQDQKVFSIMHLLNPAIKNHLITAELYEGPFFNVGTPEELMLANRHLSST
ncbi:MAG: NDP-sugar synthase [Gammaproteobacteria bacterium]